MLVCCESECKFTGFPNRTPILLAKFQSSNLDGDSNIQADYNIGSWKLKMVFEGWNFHCTWQCCKRIRQYFKSVWVEAIVGTQWILAFLVPRKTRHEWRFSVSVCDISFVLPRKQWNGNDDLAIIFSVVDEKTYLWQLTRWFIQPHLQKNQNC